MIQQQRIARRAFLRSAGGFAAVAFGQAACARAKPPEEVVPPKFLLTWGTNGPGEGQFDVPIAIVCRNDELWISDFRQSNIEAPGRIQRFDTEGRFLGAFHVEPMPGGLAFDREGLLYATHMMRHKVAVYDQAGKPLREFGKLGEAPGEFQQPGGIAFGPDGSLYVADQVNRRVQRLTPEGKPLAAWGKYGVATGEFGGNTSKASRVGGPHFLAFDSLGRLYTTEGSVGRVQKFDAEGAFLLAWGDNEIGPGHFGGATGLKGPIAIAVSAKDEVWVGATNHYVQQFTLDGQFVRRIGGEGAEPGQFRTPHGLAFDSRGHLYVVDTRNSRIQKFEV
jgi:DNA-binding beta-propeller fold protein YncE